MSKISPISTLVLDSGKLTYICKVIISGIELTAENGLINVSLRKEVSVDNKISATDFSMVLADIPQLNIFFNKTSPTYPEIMQPGADVTVYMGYARHNTTGSKTDISNHFIQWFKVMSGNTSTYKYDSKSRTLGITCYDKIEEMINRGDWNSVSFEYMTVPEILNVIANNSRTPPVLESNQIHNPIMSMYSQNTRFPAFWSGDILKVGGFTRYGQRKLPKGWHLSDKSFVNDYVIKPKEYSNYNKLYNTISFKERNNLLINSSNWKDSDADGIADWWNEINLTSSKINNAKYLGYREQTINGTTDSRFYQVVNDSSLYGKDILISGNTKTDGSYAFFLSNQNITITGEYFSNTSYRDISQTFTVPSNSTYIHVGIIPSGTVDIKQINMSNSALFFSPSGYTIVSSGTINNRTGPTKTSFNNMSDSFRLVCSGVEFESNSVNSTTLISGEYSLNKITVDMLYNTAWNIPSGEFINRTKLINTFDNIELSYDVSITGTNGKWLYDSFQLNDVAGVITSGDYTTYSGFANKLKTSLLVNNNSDLTPIFIQDIRLFNNELLGNACFKDSNADGIPDGYSYIKNGSSQIYVDSSNYVSMNQSVKMVSSDKSLVCLKKRITDITPGKHSFIGNYIAENIVVSNELNGGVFVEISAYDSSEDLLWTISAPHLKGFTDFKTFILNFDIDTSVTDIEIMFGIRFANGEAMFNDVRLFKDISVQSQPELQEFQIQMLNNDSDNFLFTNIEDVENLMYSGNMVSNIKTISINSYSEDASIQGINTINNWDLSNGITGFITDGTVALETVEKDDSIIGNTNLKIVFSG